MPPKSEGLTITGDTIKNLSVVITIVTTILGGVWYGVGKLQQIENHATRLQKIETDSQFSVAMVNRLRDEEFKSIQARTEIEATNRRVEAMSETITRMRLDIERIRALIERK